MAIDFPLPVSSPWVDPNGQTWTWNGDAWVRTVVGTGIGDAPADDTQYARENNAWAKLAPDMWYLGPHAAAPVVDNYGQLLQQGQTYYNTTTDTMRQFDGTAWWPFAPTIQIFGLTTYTWIDHAEIIAGTALVGADDYGNTAGGWLEGETIVDVFLDGVRLIEEIDNAVVAGNYTVDYANSEIAPVNANFPIDSDIVVETYRAVLGDNALDMPFTIDEDNMGSNTDTKLPTQQSVKAYVDVVQDNLIATNTGYKNLIINGNFVINQRRFNGNWATLTNFSYGYDRWYKSSVQVIGEPAIAQRISNTVLVEGDKYTLSWVGDGEGRMLSIGGSSIALGTSPVTGTFQNPGSYVLVEVPQHATDIQVERGERATSFEKRPHNIESQLCSFYFKKWWGKKEGFNVYRQGPVAIGHATSNNGCALKFCDHIMARIPDASGNYSQFTPLLASGYNTSTIFGGDQFIEVGLEINDVYMNDTGVYMQGYIFGGSDLTWENRSPVTAWMPYYNQGDNYYFELNAEIV